MRQVLQSVIDCYYKVRQVLQSVTVITRNTGFILFFFIGFLYQLIVKVSLVIYLKLNEIRL